MGDDNPHSRSGSTAKSWLERIAAIFTAEPQDLSDLEEVFVRMMQADHFVGASA